MSNSLVLSNSADLLASTEAVDRAERLAAIFAKSELIPPHLRGKPADVFVALAMASQLAVNPLVVLQSIHVINGRAGFAASFMIALANASKRFRGPIQWRERGEPGAADYEVTAYAIVDATGTEVDATVSMRMAQKEGWTRNKKYDAMPQHMLRMRAATFLVRLYAPEVLLGMHASEEWEDVAAAQGRPVEPERVEVVRVAAVVEEEAAATRTKRTPKPRTIDATPTAEHEAIAGEVLEARANREPTPEPEVVEAEAVEPQPAPEPEPPKRQHHPSWPLEYRKFFGDITRMGRDKAIVMDLAPQCPDSPGKRPSEMDTRERSLLLLWLQTPEGQKAYADLVVSRQVTP